MNICGHRSCLLPGVLPGGPGCRAGAGLGPGTAMGRGDVWSGIPCIGQHCPCRTARGIFGSAAQRCHGILCLQACGAARDDRAHRIGIDRARSRRGTNSIPPPRGLPRPWTRAGKSRAGARISKRHSAWKLDWPGSKPLRAFFVLPKAEFGKAGFAVLRENTKRTFIVSGKRSLCEDERIRTFIVSGKRSLCEDERIRTFIVSGKRSLCANDRVRAGLAQTACFTIQLSQEMPPQDPLAAQLLLHKDKIYNG